MGCTGIRTKCRALNASSRSETFPLLQERPEETLGEKCVGRFQALSETQWTTE